MKPEVRWIMNEMDELEILPEMAKSIDACVEWAAKDHGYDSKNLRIREWNPTWIDFYNIISHIFVAVLLEPKGLTYQAMIGYISGTIQCAHPLDRAKCAAEVIAICYCHELIDVAKTDDKTMMITTEFAWTRPIPDYVKHRPSYRQPDPIVENQILGCRFKQHDMDTCKSHINKMNAIPFVLDKRIIDLVPETPSKELEWREQVEDWDLFLKESQEAYDAVMQQAEFYFNHKYDTRGRTYCGGYYINYQGASFKKAIVQLANKEVVKL